MWMIGKLEGGQRLTPGRRSSGHSRQHLRQSLAERCIGPSSVAARSGRGRPS